MQDVLLIIFAFTLNPQGDIQTATVMKGQFDTLEECNAYGENLREHLRFPDEIKTLSYCVSQLDYE